MTSVKENYNVRIQIGLFCLILNLMYEYPTAVHSFLEESSHVSFLIEQIKQSSGVDPHVQGLASYLLGLCVVFNEDGQKSYTM
jgi:hypothetical protein